ncbi:MAG: hypothetical protein BGO09_01430 [Bacteroidetes bacterium 47-18]|nr:MAG: hypothetical protein BGO09_01430 [Bacteroidetes bacterium 47-18]
MKQMSDLISYICFINSLGKFSATMFPFPIFRETKCIFLINVHKGIDLMLKIIYYTHYLLFKYGRKAIGGRIIKKYYKILQKIRLIQKTI